MPSDKLYFVQIVFCFGKYLIILPREKTLDYATDMQLLVSMQLINKLLVLTLFMLFTFTFSHLADAFIQSDLQLGNSW